MKRTTWPPYWPVAPEQSSAAAGPPTSSNLLRGEPPPPEVTVPTRRRVPGVKTRRSHVPRDERTFWRRIPVTSVPTTLVDLAPILDADSLARACHEAGVRHRTTPAQVERSLARRPN